MTDNGGKSGESRNATRSVPVERIKHSDAIALTRPVLLGSPSRTVPPLRSIFLLSPSFLFRFLISIDEVKHDYLTLKTYNRCIYISMPLYFSFICIDRLSNYRLYTLWFPLDGGSK